MALRINPRLLNQSFDYYEFMDIDIWGKASYKDPLTIKNVRIDEGVNGIIFAYASEATPFIKFKRRSKVVTKNGTFIINKIVKINEPFEDKLWSVELELI